MSGLTAVPLSLSLLFQAVGWCLLQGGGSFPFLPAADISQSAPSREDVPLLYKLLILSKARQLSLTSGAIFWAAGQMP